MLNYINFLALFVFRLTEFAFKSIILHFTFLFGTHLCYICAARTKLLSPD